VIAEARLRFNDWYTSRIGALHRRLCTETGRRCQSFVQPPEIG